MGGEGETVEEAVSLRACMAAHLPAAAFSVCVMRCVQAELIRFDSKAAADKHLGTNPPVYENIRP
ncbi:hypothetical protein [Geobacillus stearothermophilus]|uniref:Uncharacterized protein n=1 Tax=Geobacillus stearothermophilus TaxID=1422 RepID=A0A3L7DAV4_GEOSE|nr:hypothetical protein [Geobacillus stearothermophilus]RLQ09797.1 hypothetical protein D9549_04000 [Geobacillus stearothermophilus]RLQ11840.1 hypothetical protein D9547_04000 [Geobacillus stearothermophilus]RLQ14764.1 hypothetical protein D9548_04080 [Geobacillus stearothermophilus]